MSKEQDKRIEETIKKIGMTTYGCIDFEPSAEYKKELTKILQSLLDEQKKEIAERMKDYVANAPLEVKMSKIPYEIINSITKD